jgi:hypothetical protein
MMGGQQRLKLAKRTVCRVVIGVAWYRRDQWARLRKVAPDPEILEDTYDEWLLLANDTKSQLEREGIETQRVDIDVEELVGWCRVQHRAIDQAARGAFARFKLQEYGDAAAAADAGGAG